MLDTGAGVSQTLPEIHWPLNDLIVQQALCEPSLLLSWRAAKCVCGRQPGAPVFEALTARGLRLVPHTTRVPTNVSNTADYDQLAVVPGLVRRVVSTGVFDFDGALFSGLYNPAAPGRWRTCVKYYISDHRPLWMQFRLT